MNESTITFSICVPTYNRGRKALELVKDVVPRLEPGWALIIIDNCSSSECAEYEEIAKLAKVSPGKLTYIHNAVNSGFNGNYLNCFRYTRSDLAMFISDEDRPNLAIIPTALNLSKERPTLGIIRGSILPLMPGDPRRNSFTLRDEVYTAGKDALRLYALSNNYLSGTIYNKRLLSELGLIERFEKNLLLHHAYPHLYLECLACAVTDVALCAETSCFEGTPQFLSSGPNVCYIPPYSFGCRVDQFLVLRDCLREAVEILDSPFNSELFGNLYLRHTAKYFHLVGRANAALYAKNGIDVGVAVRSFAYFACAAMIRLKECEQHRDFLMEEIDKLARQFGG